MTTLREAADAARDMPLDVLAQFDAVFARQPLDPRKVTMEAVLNAMKPAIAPRED